jgi:hypothetical protein
MCIILIFLVKVWVESGLASTEKSGDNLLIHHSRNTEQKQWSETQVCSYYSSFRYEFLYLHKTKLIE